MIADAQCRRLRGILRTPSDRVPSFAAGGNTDNSDTNALETALLEQLTGDQGVLQGVNSRSDISHAASERHVTWNKAIRYLAGQEENKATDSYGTDTLNDGLQTSSEDDEEQPRMMSRHELNVGGLQAEYLINTEDSKTGDHDLYKPSSCTSTAAKGAQETGNSLAELIRPNVRKTTFPPKQPKGATSTTHNRKRRGEGNRHVDIHPAKSYTHLVGLPESSFEEQHRRFLVQRKQHDEMKIVKRMMADCYLEFEERAKANSKREDFG